MTTEQMQKMEDVLVGIKEELASQREQIKGALRRIDEQSKLTESVHKLATSIEILTNEQKSMVHQIEGLSKDVEEIKLKPAKTHDDIVKLIITTVVTAVVTFFITKFAL